MIQHIGFDPEIPHVNVSERPKNYRSAYSDQTAKAVSDMCSEDIVRFGYTF